MRTVKVWLAGKFAVWIVTVFPGSTLTMLNVGIVAAASTVFGTENTRVTIKRATINAEKIRLARFDGVEETAEKNDIGHLPILENSQVASLV
jgi:hypothetical protein